MVEDCLYAVRLGVVLTGYVRDLTKVKVVLVLWRFEIGGNVILRKNLGRF